MEFLPLHLVHRFEFSTVIHGGEVFVRLYGLVVFFVEAFVAIS